VQIDRPKVHPWGDEGPPEQDDEIRRHLYPDSAGKAVRIKIKRTSGFIQWYRVEGGWQAKKPNDFQAVPFVSEALNPFDPELKDDQIFWPEGENDVDSLSMLNQPAFTFGGVGDGLPDGIESYLRNRHVVILADNDEPGREHAEKKAARAHAAGARSIKIVSFPELEPKADVTDFVAGGGTVEQLLERADAAPVWQPPNEPTAPIGKGERGLVMRCMADIQSKKIEWLLPAPLRAGSSSDRSNTTTSQPTLRSRCAAKSPPTDPPITSARGLPDMRYHLEGEGRSASNDRTVCSIFFGS
jgi:hypothetical protein